MSGSVDASCHTAYDTKPLLRKQTAKAFRLGKAVIRASPGAYNGKGNSVGFKKIAFYVKDQRGVINVF